jgi:hypothetical protein
MMNGQKQTIPPQLRWEVWERDNYTCHYCGSRRRLSIDHKVPESQGGALEPDNLVTCCGSCNSSKGIKSYDDFKEDKAFDLAFWHYVKLEVKNEGSFSPYGEMLRRTVEYAQVRVCMLQLPGGAADLQQIDPETGKWQEYWVLFPSALPEHFAELIRDRRNRGLDSEADKYTVLAVEKFGPDFVRLLTAGQTKDAPS